MSRVTVNYGVSLEEVPRLLGEMLDKCMDLNKQADGLFSVVSYAIANNNEQLLAEAIHNLRITLSSADLNLGDLNDMAVGYIRHLKAASQPPKVPPQPTAAAAEEDLGILDDE